MEKVRRRQQKENEKEPQTWGLEHLQRFSVSGSAEFDDNTSLQIAQSSSCSGSSSQLLDGNANAHRVARELLTDEEAHALGEAVAVARQRSHSQTTSIHAVSALLALPASTLRDACSRATTSAYSSGRQFRPLHLCLANSLDELPTSKALDEDPPVSNSLMVAIKRGPFSGGLDDDDDGDDDVSRRMGEASVKRDGKGRNLFLVGAYASNAIKGFVNSVNKENNGGVLPSEIRGVIVMGIEDEVIQFVRQGGGDREKC
ncbi:unnamed protein product [Dovyalis caffra]|uniref:Clp R domain-containing protein n=1 Tax=Dovyalis caffra TaxID=77055 RepID=A0AAV1RSB6_9ROSI|nr:unnamed protein product [Dovyalis caffra]